MNKKSVIGIILSCAIIIGGIYYLTSSDESKITYLTEIVKRGDLQKSVIASGTVRSYYRVEVGAQASGKIEKMYVKLGQQVKAGDLIAEINSETQTNTLNTAKAQLASYQAQFKSNQVAYNIAKSTYDRVSKLYHQKAASLDEFNTAQNTLASAEATIKATQTLLQQAEIAVSTAKTNLGYTQITSPIDGTIISIPVSVGQTVNANQTTPTIVQVADLSKMLIKPEISEGDITKVQAGQTVTFSTLSDPDTHYQATIDSVDPATSTLTDNEYSESVTDTNPVYYYANVVVNNPGNKLRIGMTTQNTITIAEAKNVLMIPTTTLHKQNNKIYVNILNTQNQTEQREVVIGLNDDMNTEIKSGLKEGEKVISSEVNAGEQVGDPGRGPRMF